ncbi:MAG: hypothetical protein J2P54_16570 [Bradyrhizobiaceae bacterium]|nr:hypothetical protein [Bradyrhizobiaceae bacterium]
MQADSASAASGTFMFSVMQSDRLRVFVLRAAGQTFEFAPGVDALMREPEIPGRTFPGEVIRIANALRPVAHTLPIEIPNPDRALSPRIYCTMGCDPQNTTTTLVSNHFQWP